MKPEEEKAIIEDEEGLNEIIAAFAHEVNRAYCESMGDHSQPTWKDAPDEQKQSAVDGVIFHRLNPQATPEQSHKMWMAGKLARGWKHGKEKDNQNKTHPCLLPFAHLPPEQRAKDFLFKTVVRQLSDLLLDIMT